MPLAVEEVYALVPVTSRLRELDDLRGRRINVGAPGSPRAKSAEALYRALFGQPLPSAPLRSKSKEVALRALLLGEGLDAMLLFDGQPSSWLAALPVETRLQLSLLRFDPTRASGQRALQSYLATSVTPTLVTEPAPVPTLGEVTFLVASRGQATSPDLVRRLCERLPALRAGGHPKWKDIDPAALLPMRLPRSPDIASAVQACATSRISPTASSESRHENTCLCPCRRDAARRGIFAVRPGSRRAGGRRSTGGRARHRPLRVQPHDGVAADQQSLLAEVATMKDVTWRTVSAEGYADSVGQRPYNQRLSARRAKAVRAFLLGKGLDPQMVQAQGKGAADPVADNATAEGRAQNRRTEVTFRGCARSLPSH